LIEIETPSKGRPLGYLAGCGTVAPVKGVVSLMAGDQPIIGSFRVGGR
jgi:hypothetical protein